MAPGDYGKELFLQLSLWNNGTWWSCKGTLFPVVRVKKWHLIIIKGNYFSICQREKIASDGHVRELFFQLPVWKNWIWFSWENYFSSWRGKRMASDDHEETIFLAVRMKKWHLMIMWGNFYSGSEDEKMASDYHVREVFFWLSGCENGIWLSCKGTIL